MSLSASWQETQPALQAAPALQATPALQAATALQVASTMQSASPDARARAFTAARRHSRLVRILRIVLPATGLAAIAALIALTQLGLPLDIDISAARLSVTPNAVIMESPNLTGFDNERREYSVAAERAIQSLTNPNQVRLEAIKATVAGEDGATIVTAATGEYDHSARTLRLEGDVTVDSAEGYGLRMLDVNVDFLAGSMQTDRPVTVIYEDSEITSQRFTATDGGRHLLFDGGVRTTIMPPKREGPPAETEERAQ